MILMCAVCFQGADPVMRESLNAGILVLLGVTGVVLACLASFFVRLAWLAHKSAGEPYLEDILRASVPAEGVLEND